MSNAPEPEPFGRYLIPLAERFLYLPTVAAFCLFVRVDAGQDLPNWYRWALLTAITCLIFAIIPQWVVPATSISPERIRRNFAAQRKLDWDDIADFTIKRSWGVRRVHAELLSGRKLRLDGVPLKTLTALRNQKGAGQIKYGSWWLVDYAVGSTGASSTGSS